MLKYLRITKSSVLSHWERSFQGMFTPTYYQFARNVKGIPVKSVVRATQEYLEQIDEEAAKKRANRNKRKGIDDPNYVDPAALKEFEELNARINNNELEIHEDEVRGVYATKDYKEYDKTEEFQKSFEEASPVILEEYKRARKSLEKKIRKAERVEDAETVESAKKELEEHMKEMKKIEENVEKLNKRKEEEKKIKMENKQLEKEQSQAEKSDDQAKIPAEEREELPPPEAKIREIRREDQEASITKIKQNVTKNLPHPDAKVIEELNSTAPEVTPRSSLVSSKSEEKPKITKKPKDVAEDPEFDEIIEKFASYDSPIDELVEEQEQKNQSRVLKDKMDQKIDPKKLEKIERKLQAEEKKLETDILIEGEQEAGEQEQEKQKKAPKIVEYRQFVKQLHKKKTTEKFYEFLRTVKEDNLIKLLSQHDLIDKFPKQNIAKYLILMSFMRKHKTLQNYNREDIYQTLDTIIKHIDVLSPLEVSSIAVNLNKMRINKLEYFKAIEVKVLQDANKYDLRSIANIVHAFAHASSKQSIIDDFSDLYRKFETIISLKLANKTPQDICQIASGYSKAQAFSPEFLYVIEQSSLDLFDKMNTQEVAVILHCFAKNEYESKNFNDLARNLVIKRSDKFKIMEIALISEALYQFKAVDNSFLSIVEKNLAAKMEHANAQDLAIFCKVLFKPEYSMKKTTLDALNKSLNLLYHNVDANCLKKMFEDFEERYKAGKYDEEYINFIFRKLRNLRKDDMIKGVNFTYIKGQIIKLKGDDMLRKKIEKALGA